MSNGMIIYEGPSRLDGAPIVVIAVGLKQRSTNTKTGEMVQTYILRRDMPPADAIKTGADASICGACPHRGDGTGKGRSCYVTIMHGPRGVWMAYQRGNYPKADPDVAGRMVRLGTYGDPAAVPIVVWQRLLKDAAGWTGYTHQWKSIHPAWAKLCMASVDSEAELHLAQAKGFRTFRVTPSAHENIKGLEIICPASEEAGKLTQCEDCRACMGTSGKARVSIQIAAHGSGRSHVREYA
jgi:hypothetical protein